MTGINAIIKLSAHFLFIFNTQTGNDYRN